MTPLQLLGPWMAARVGIDERTGCWPFLGSVNPQGYGNVIRDGKSVKAYRYAYLLVNGPDSIPPGLELDHLCRNPPCVNPAHLEPVTHAENIRRAMGDRKRPEPKTHCKRGHELTPDNTRWNGPNRRQCRRCFNDMARLSRLRRIAAQRQQQGATA